jgi:hypothetical protein
VTRTAIILPVIFKKASRDNKRHVDIKLKTQGKLGNDVFAELDMLQDAELWAMLAVDQFDEKDVPKEDTPGDGRKPQAEVIRDLLWHQAEKNGIRDREAKEAFIRTRLESFIGVLRKELYG